MKQKKWLVSAGVLFAALVAIEGWPALRDLSVNREWRPVGASPDGATLDGLQVAIATQVAAIAEQKPERAAVLVRLTLQVTPGARAAWQDCRVSLRNKAGEVWMPLTSASSDGAIKALSPDQKNVGPCRLFARGEQAGIETVQADQLFLLPANGLQGLQLHVSGQGTRPQALSFPVAPTVRRLP